MGGGGTVHVYNVPLYPFVGGQCAQPGTSWGGSRYACGSYIVHVALVPDRYTFPFLVYFNLGAIVPVFARYVSRVVKFSPHYWSSDDRTNLVILLSS
jgi:hypothetical protein